MDIGVTEPKILFVGGSGRSGTSITRVILGQHPSVASIPFEYRFLIDPDGILEFCRTYSLAWSPYMADKQFSRLFEFLSLIEGQSSWSKLCSFFARNLSNIGLPITPRRYNGWNLSSHIPEFSKAATQLKDELLEFSYSGSWVGQKSYTPYPKLNSCKPLAAAEVERLTKRFCWTVLNSLIETKGKDILVEDNTWNFLFADELKMIFPHSKLIHVYRDPRDVIVSFKEQRWCPSSTTQAATWYQHIMERWLTVRSSLDPKYYREISLESLVREPQAVIISVCDFIGIDYTPSAFKFDVLKADSIGRWKHALAEEEKELLSDKLSKYITLYKY